MYIDVFNILLTLIIGYLFGIIQSAFFIGKLNGVNVKAEGSKNAGASNIVMLLGWKYGILVFVIDLLKSLIPVIIFSSLFDNSYLPAIAGLGAILGHIFPFFMNFNGGKGFSCYIGLIIGLNFGLGLYFVIFAGLLVIVTNYVALATILSVIILNVGLNFNSSTSIFFPYFDNNILFVISVASIIIIIKHLINLSNILKRKEKTFWSVVLKKK